MHDTTSDIFCERLTNHKNINILRIYIFVMIDTLIKMMEESGYKGYIIQSSHGIHFTPQIQVAGDDIMITYPLYITSPLYDKHDIRMSPEFLADTDISTLTNKYNWVKCAGNLIITYVYEIAGIINSDIIFAYHNMANNLPTT